MTSSRAKVLCVDDEVDILLILRTSLRDDYEVDTASNGPEALEKMETGGYDLIILDMMMPEMTGIQVLEELRQREKTASTPVIFLTGVSDKAKIREALDKGTQYYIVKPFKTNDLLSKAQMALAQR